MLGPEERAERVVALRALKARGVISDKYILGHRDEIAKAMDPLPAPWKWESMRVRTGLAATAMEKRSGVPQMRIRHWEKGGGTTSEELWVQYADALADVMQEMGLDSSEWAAERLDRPVSTSVQALVEQQRVVSNALSTWVGQAIPCQAGDIMLLLDSLRASRENIMVTQRLLRDRLRSATQVRVTGRKDEGDGTTGEA
jgi:hypothetical protein